MLIRKTFMETSLDFMNNEVLHQLVVLPWDQKGSGVLLFVVSCVCVQHINFELLNN